MIPTNPIKRFIKVATIPARAVASESTQAAGKMLGVDMEEFSNNSRKKLIKHIFLNLGQLKGGATKLAQVLVTFESAIPTEMVGVYREALIPLLEAGPSLNWEDLNPPKMPENLTVEKEAVAAASLGQVHKGTWKKKNGEIVDVAVKIQYPNIEKAIKADIVQMKILASTLSKLVGSLGMRHLLEEHVKALLNELDYTKEAENQKIFRKAWSKDKRFIIPQVYFASERVLVTEWVEGKSLTELCKEGHGTQTPSEERNLAGSLLLEFTLTNPTKVGKVHGDPHAGNFKLLENGKLAILDFGAVTDSAGFVNLFKQTSMYVSTNQLDKAYDLWKTYGILEKDVPLDVFVNFIDSDPKLYDPEGFQFTPDWMREQAKRWWDPNFALTAGKALNLPVGALLEHRSVMGSLALVSQMYSNINFLKLVSN